MIVEHLHVQKGDKKKDVPTNSPEERKEAKAYIDKLLHQGTALFLERGKKTYRIRGYDPDKDRLLVEPAEGQTTSKRVPARPDKGRVTAVPPVRGGQ